MTWAEWWGRVLDSMQDPAWMSGVLQGAVSSVVGTLIALLGAGWVLLIQLRHDRELSARQSQEAQEAWAADRRAHAANEVGLLLLEAVDEILELDEDEWNRRLIMTTPPQASLYAITNAQQIPGMSQIKQAIKKARLTLNLDSAIGDLESEIAANWYVSIQLSEHPSLSGLTAEQTTTVLHRASRHLLWDSRDALRDLGRALCRWDGREDPPGLAALRRWKPRAGGRVPPQDPEREQMLAAAGTTVTELVEVLGYRSSPVEASEQSTEEA